MEGYWELWSTPYLQGTYSYVMQLHSLNSFSIKF